MSDGTVKIETSLDTSGVEKDLKKVENTIQNSGKKIQSTMDNVEKSMKKASSSFDGSKIAKQLDNVGKSIDKTNSSIDKQKDKLSKLQQAYEKAGSTKQKDNISKQMETTTASIAKLETKLKGLKDKEVKLKVKMDGINDLDGEFRSASVKAVNELDKIDKKAEQVINNIRKNMGSLSIGDGIIKVGDKISSFGDTLTRNVTLPIAGAGIAAAKVGMDFESQMSRVKAISGATGEEIKKLHDQALQLGADTKYSAKEAAQGMENLASAGFTTNEIMSAMPGLLDLAASSGESLANSSDIAAGTLRGFGLEASQAGHVADVLAKNAGATSAAVVDTGEAMKYIAPVAKAMGLSLEEVTAAIGVMANQQIKGSQAGTTLRSALTRLASPSKEAAGMMETLGFKAFDSQGKLKPLSGIIDGLSKSLKGKTDQQKQDAIATIFGQEAMSGMLALIDSGSESLDKLTNSYKVSDGAAKEMAKTMQDNSKSAIEQMTGSIETAAIKLEEVAAPSIITIANEVQELANEFSKLSPEVQKNVIEYALMAAAAGPVVKTVGMLTSGIGSLISIGGKLGALLGIIETGATAGGVALGTLAVASTAAVAAAAAITVGVAAYATAQVQLHQNLSKTTDDMSDWEKAINGMTGYTFKSRKELEQLGIEYKDFGDNISDSFKDKVKESTKTLHEFELFLGKMDLDKAISIDESNSFDKQINDIINKAISTIQSKKSEVNSKFSELFMGDDSQIDATEQKVLEFISKGYDTQIKEEESLKKDVLAIKQKAVDEKRALNDQEVKDVQAKLTRIKEIELDAVGGTQEEQDYAKNEFGARVSKVNPTDASELLKEKKKVLDEENTKIEASYNTQLDMLKRNLAKADGENKTAIQAEIDKFTKLRDDKLKLKKDEWKTYLDILKEKNPEAMALIDEYNGEELTKEDSISQQKLKKMGDTFKGLNDITKSGTYELENTQTNSLENVTVKVDENTGKVIAAYSETSMQVGGYTDEMANDVKKLGQEHLELTSKCEETLSNLAGAHVNAAGEISNSSGIVVGKLKEVKEAEDGTVSGILEVNGTPIEIKTNGNGIISNMEAVKKAIENIPKTKTVTIQANLSGDSIQYLQDEKLFTRQIRQNYTGTSGEEGLTTLHEHGWEMSTGENELYYLGGGTGILDHQSSVSAMKNEVSDQVGSSVGRIVSKLVSTLGGQNSLLSQVVKNTLETANTGKEGVKVNQKLATDLLSNISKSTTGTFGDLQNELTTANDNKEKASKMKAEDNYWVSYYKQWIDSIESNIDSIRDKMEEATDESVKKQLQAQQKVLDKQKDSLQKEYQASKEAAEKEIQIAKDTADQQVKIAEEKKDKLIKLSEAVTEALKTELEGQKAAAEKVINDELSAMEKSYNSKIAKIEADTKKKTDKIDAELKALEEENNENSREKERAEANNTIFKLETTMANTASYADKRSLQLQINEARKALQEKEDTWNIEDQKAQLEEEKSLLQERSDNRKKSLEEQYNREKEEKEAELKDTQAYYDKLLQEDSINAQARYMLLQGNQEELVALLQSYNPLWQDAGQSLADSLLTGLNSQKQSVQDAVSEMIGIRGTTAKASASNVAYYDEKGNLLKGYASGTDYNHLEDLYLTNEKGFELNTAGDVAYVSKGAGIKNHMESLKYIDSEIGRQVALMKNSILSEQYKLANLVTGAVSSVTNNSKTVQYDGSNQFLIQELHLHNQQDTEQFFNEAETIRQKNKKC